MRAIDQSLVDETWREITGYAPDRAEAEAQAFLRRQPHAAAFCRLVTREFDPAAQKAALGLTFLLFKVLEADRGSPLPRLAERRIRAAYATTTEWLEQWEGADPRFFLRSLEGAGPQPSLVQYLLAAFYSGDPGSAEYEDEIRASLFLLLKTLTDALVPSAASR